MPSKGNLTGVRHACSHHARHAKLDRSLSHSDAPTVKAFISFSYSSIMFSFLRFAALLLCVQASEYPLKQAERADVVQRTRRRSLHLLSPRASPIPCPDGHIRDTAGTCCPAYGESPTLSVSTFLILPPSAFSSATKLYCQANKVFKTCLGTGCCIGELYKDVS